MVPFIRHWCELIRLKAGRLGRKIISLVVIIIELGCDSVSIAPNKIYKLFSSDQYYYDSYAVPDQARNSGGCLEQLKQEALPDSSPVSPCQNSFPLTRVANPDLCSDLALH